MKNTCDNMVSDNDIITNTSESKHIMADLRNADATTDTILLHTPIASTSLNRILLQSKSKHLRNPKSIIAINDKGSSLLKNVSFCVN